MNNFQGMMLGVMLAMTATAAPCQDDIPVINIENRAVQAYMADSTYYTDYDYNTSVVTSYNTSAYPGSRSLPQGMTVTWSHTAPVTTIDTIIVTASEHEDFSRAFTATPLSNVSTSCTVYNMMPGRTYRYKVEETLTDGSVNIAATGMFRTEGQVRMLNIDGVANARDMGGWPTRWGRRLCYGKLYRSGDLDLVTPRGIDVMTGSLGVGAELDMRSTATLTGSPLGPDVDYIMIATGHYFHGVTVGPAAFARDLKWVVDRLREGKPVDIHCRIGCDRTGTIGLLIEGLLGVEEPDLCRDFELSTFGGRTRPRNYVSDKYGGFAEIIPYIKTYGDPGNLAQCFYNYWLAAGVPAEDLDYLRSTMLEGVDGDLNGDSTVDIDDLNTLVDILLGRDTDDTRGKRADVDYSGKADIADAGRIIEALLGRHVLR